MVREVLRRRRALPRRPARRRHVRAGAARPAVGAVSTGILPGWRDLNPGEELERRLGRAGLRRQRRQPRRAGRAQPRGRPRHAATCVYVKVASGLGAGIVLGGRLHRGTSGIAGEIGHVQVGEDGQVCRCGNRGCLETVVSAPRLIRLLQPAYDDELLDRAGRSSSTRPATPAYDGCSATPGRTVGRALADLANSLNPELVVVGGSLGPSTSLVDGDPGLDRPLRAAGHRRGGAGGRRRARRPRRGDRRGRARDRPGRDGRERLTAGRAATTGCGCWHSARPASAARDRR